MKQNHDNHYIEFREPQTQAELEGMLKLRYQVRRSCELAALCPENEAAIDIDQFDRYALHVGLFARENGRMVPVAANRVVTDQLGPNHQWVEGIAQKFSRPEALLEPEVVFPSIGYLPKDSAHLMQAFYEQAKLEGKRVGESCGTVIQKNYRSARTATRWVDAIVAYFKVWKRFDWVTMTVSENHETFYLRYGFEQFRGIPAPWGSPYGVPGTQLLIKSLLTTGPVAERVFRMAEELSHTGKIVVSQVELGRRPQIASQPCFRQRGLSCLLA